MYDRGKIITGLILFIGLVAFPVYYNMGKTTAKPDDQHVHPAIDTPVIQQLEEKQCVESRSFMRANHMQLLNHWRDSVVRDGNRVYVGAGGKKYLMSLQNTCLNCHSNKREFCDRCHSYVNVKPYCWNCHIVPKENNKLVNHREHRVIY